MRITPACGCGQPGHDAVVSARDAAAVGRDGALPVRGGAVGDIAAAVGRDAGIAGRDGPRPDRRRVIGAALAAGLLAAASPPPAAAAAVEAPAEADDERFMRVALEEAAKADFPFGACIVRDGEVLVRGRNLGRTTNDPTAHGEMVAIRRFLDVRPAADLEGTTLYTSGEPCPMCMSAIVWCGIARVVFAASIEELSTKIGQIMVPAREIAARTPFLSVRLTGGVLAKEAMGLFG